MSNIQSYNALIDRFKAFASGHYILKAFSHGQINEADLAKFSLYPFMHVVPADVTYDRGTKTFSFQIILADLPRDKEDKTEYQKEVLSDLQRIAEDLIAEITNHRMLFGELITCQNVSIQPFLEEFHHTLTGWTVSIDLLVPYYWDACSIPAEWNDMFESSTGSTGTILSFEDSIVRDENGIVTLVNDEANPSPNYYYGTNEEGVRGWFELPDSGGLTCQTIGNCQTIIDIESAIDLLQTDVTQLQTDVALKANIADISAVGFSNDYNDLDNKPTIPAGGLPAGGTAGQILTKVDSTDYNATWQENYADWTSVVKHTVKNNGTQTLDKGKAVYITTSNGTNMLVGYASNNTEATSSKTIGLLQSTLTTTGTNSTGFVITEGLLGGLNTQGTTAGDPIWLGVDGNLIYGLANKPYAPAHLVFIGIVTKVSAGNGEIFVKVQNGFELKEIHDVDLVTTTPVNGNVLGFDGTLWVNKTVAGWLGFTPVTNARTISTSAPLSGGGDLSADRTLSISQATTSTNGYLTSTDWNTFNNKQSALGYTPLAGVHSIIPMASGDVTYNGVAASTSPSVQTGQSVRVAPYIPAQSITTSNLFISVTTATAGSLCTIVIYSDLNGVPNTRLYESADLDCSTTGLKTATTSFNFVAGTRYWLGIKTNATTSSRLHLSSISSLTLNMTGANTNIALQRSGITYASPAPSPFGTPSLTTVASCALFITKA